MGLRTWIRSTTLRARPAADYPDISPWFAGKDFTSDWITKKLDAWFEVLGPIKGQPLSALEVGSYEGRSAVALLEYMPRCHLTCVDAFFDPETEKRFDHNLAPYGDRLIKLKGRAAAALDTLQSNNRRFDVIYLDCGKTRAGVFALSALAWPLLKPQGVLIWDDLRWGRDRPPAERPGPAIELFRDTFCPCMSVLHQGRQLIVRKTAEWPRP